MNDETGRLRKRGCVTAATKDDAAFVAAEKYNVRVRYIILKRGCARKR